MDLIFSCAVRDICKIFFQSVFFCVFLVDLVNSDIPRFHMMSMEQVMSEKPHL